jgi:hypothetical protein
MNRALASGQWTLGVPILLCLIPAAVAGANATRSGTLVRLLLASVVSLHAAHVPYWFDGILHWHYVFESAPLLVILATFGAGSALIALKGRLGARTSMAWLVALFASGLATSWIDVPDLWGLSRVSLAVGEQSFSRVRMAQFQHLIAAPAVTKPCLILVDESAADPQLSFIINPPDLMADALIARMPASPPVSQTDHDAWIALRRTWPDRTVYRFDPARMELTRLAVPDRTSPVE